MEVALPPRRMDFALSADGRQAFALLTDGRLRRLDTATGGTAAVIPVLRAPNAGGSVTARMALRGASLAVSDAVAGEVALLEATTLVLHRRLRVGGAPRDVLLVRKGG